MSKEIEKVQFAALAMTTEDITEIITENLGDEGIALSDLGRINRDGKEFVIPGVEGEEIVKSFDAVIIAQTYQRGYWKHSFDETGGADPDCFSRDAKIGEFDATKFVEAGDTIPTADCKTCPLAEFNSGKNGGQACTKSLSLLVLLPDNILPYTVRIPVGSISDAKKYFTALIGKKSAYYGVITHFETIKKESSAGISYDGIKLTAKEFLSLEDKTKLKEFSKGFKQHN